MASTANKAAREVELKLAVTDGDALAAVASLAGGSADAPEQQENTFFDTKALSLDKGRYTVRVRLAAGVSFLTFKGPGVAPSASQSGALTSRVEEEWIISSGEAELMLAAQLDPLFWLQERQDLSAAQRAVADRLAELAAGEPLVPVASFHNERTRVYTSLDVAGAARPVTLELDRTTFPDGTLAAEVELELDDDAEAGAFESALRQLLERASAGPAPAASKAARVFAWVRAQHS